MAWMLAGCGHHVDEEETHPQWVRELTDRPCAPIDPPLDRWVERNDILENGNTDQPM